MARLHYCVHGSAFNDERNNCTHDFDGDIADEDEGCESRVLSSGTGINKGEDKRKMDLIKTARKYFSHLKEIPSAGIVLSEEVRNLCKQNTCGFYGKNWTCPPAVDSLDTFRDRFAMFDSMLIVYQVYPVKSSFDWNGMTAGAKEFKDRFQALKKEVEAAVPGGNFMFLGAGGCHLCKPCAYVEGEPCRNPEDAIISLEACGIDVMRLMKDHDMKYFNGKDTVTFIGGILFNTNGC